jgi:hypothetical protein
MTDHEPIRIISDKTPEEGGEVKQRGYDIVYQEEYRKYMNRRDVYKDNMKKLYSHIFQNHCPSSIQGLIEKHPEFESKIRDDPIELLLALRNITHQPQRVVYPVASLVAAVENLHHCKQRANQHLNEYQKEFKQCRDVIVEMNGTRTFDGFVDNGKLGRSIATCKENFSSLTTMEKKKLEDDEKELEQEKKDFLDAIPPICFCATPTRKNTDPAYASIATRMQTRRTSTQRH